MPPDVQRGEEAPRGSSQRCAFCVRRPLHIQGDADRTRANCEAASFSVSFCAACRTSAGAQSGKGVTKSLCLPAGVCTSFKAESLGLENRPANETRARSEEHTSELQSP